MGSKSLHIELIYTARQMQVQTLLSEIDIMKKKMADMDQITVSNNNEKG